MKICTRCKLAKPPREFPKASRKCSLCKTIVTFEEVRLKNKILAALKKKAKDAAEKKRLEDLDDDDREA